MYIVTTFLVAIIANVTYVYISFNDNVRMNAFKAYPFAITVSALGGAAWVYLVRNLDRKHIFATNLSWDVLVTLLCTLLPIVMYGIKLDFKAVLGCILAIAGVVLVHFGEAK